MSLVLKTKETNKSSIQKIFTNILQFAVDNGMNVSKVNKLAKLLDSLIKNILIGDE